MKIQMTPFVLNTVCRLNVVSETGYDVGHRPTVFEFIGVRIR